jgi:hypothetical protein
MSMVMLLVQEGLLMHLVELTAVSGLVSHRKAPGSNLASWQIVWLIQAAIAVFPNLSGYRGAGEFLVRYLQDGYSPVEKYKFAGLCRAARRYC